MATPLLLLSACQPVEQPEQDDFVRVDEPRWIAKHNKPWPFTAFGGEIMCDDEAIYFYPDDTGDDETQIGQPLNQAAIDRLRDTNLTQTVPNTLKDGVNLDEYGESFARYCDE